jgi:hypothetical protein
MIGRPAPAVKESGSAAFRPSPLPATAGPSPRRSVWPGSDPYLPRPFDILAADPEQRRLRLFFTVEGRGYLERSILGSVREPIGMAHR